MEPYEDDDDTHFCIKCHLTVNGLDNYVRHRQSGCRPPEAKQEAAHETPTTPTTVTYPEILNADAFFSSLELQSSSKSNPTPRACSRMGRERKAGKSEDRKKKVRRGQEPDDGGAKEKLLNMPPVVTDLDDLMDHLGIPSLVGFPEIVASTTTKSSAATSSKLTCVASSSSSSKVNNDENLRDSPLEGLMTSSKGSGDRKRNADSQRIDQDHGEWLEDTMLVDLDANSENKDVGHSELASYAEYDYQQDVESDEDSLDDEIGDEDSYSDDDYADDREYPHHRHTGGKWKPSELLQDMSRLNEDELEQDDDNQEHPPVVHTGGKWKPADSSQLQRVEAEDEVAGKDPGASSLTPSATSRQQPPPGHTRGKWIPGAAGDLGSGYWCDPCGRKLASRLLYNRHLLSDLHARRSIQEIDGDLQLPRGVGPLLQRKSASKRQRALAEIKSRAKVPNPVEDKETTKKKTRRREKEVLWCEMCHARVRRPQMGKHLLSHYHCRVTGTNPCSSPAARRFILENMGNVVRQCPFQCASCRFYCNTEETFLLHWRSKLHATRFNDTSGNYKCTPCNFWCTKNEAMEQHLQSPDHREVVAMMNGSVPVVVRRQKSLVCETCNQHFRYNLQLRFHMRKTGHRGNATATDEYQSKIACGLCSQVFKSLVALQRHQLSCHGREEDAEDEDSKAVVQPSAPYFCSFCTLKFTTAKEAVLHRRTPGHKEIVRAQKLSAENIDALGRECPHCNAKQSSLVAHKEHLLERHPELCHRCPQCGMLFALPQDVTRHTRNDTCRKTSVEIVERVASGSEEWRCSNCSFFTNSQAEFIFHDALHVGSIETSADEAGTSKALAKYRCPMCEKSFTKGSLRNHIRSHTGERPFHCVKCSASFPRRSSLNAHRKECVTPSTTSASWPKGIEGSRQRNHTCSECSTAFYTNQIESRWISYQEVYTKRKLGIFKKLATRINYRIEHFVTDKIVNQCCPGYRPERMETTQCYPICPSGCFNGKCSQVNVCTCNPGFRAVVTDNQSHCAPYCPHDGPSGCGLHGTCLAPNTCICHIGYGLTVTDTNGKSTSDFPCIPLCAPKCGNNSFCQSPNTCTCNVGYTRIGPDRLIDKSIFACEPSCVPKCGNNMNCFAPNKCQCDAGYTSDTSGTCSPVCDPPCINATCTRPGYCECHNGYKKDPKGSPQKCLPVCDPPCVNATCTRPGYCECHNGYEKDPKGSPEICSPVCDPPCTNGTCSEPNHCECHGGYEKKLKNQPQLCSPVCNPECSPNAFCDMPNKCLCDAGYTVVTTNSSTTTTSTPMQTIRTATISNFNEVTCKPVCDPECKENESCVAPNVCQCDPGYRADVVEVGSTRCLPICTPSCVNSYCGHPNKCICFSGYAPSVFENFACDPVCQYGCVNASCTLPNHCECYDGYEKASTPTGLPDTESPATQIPEIYEHTCVPSCPGQCLNGTCVAPGECSCDDGYVLKTISFLETQNETTTVDYAEDSNTTDVKNVTYLQFCEPFCEPDCPFGLKCLSPNQCEPQIEDASNSTHTINSIEDCGRNVDYLDENYNCICKLGWTGWRCAEPSLCALLMRISSDDSKKSTSPQSIESLSNNTTESTYDDINDMRMISSDDERGTIIEWEGPMCMEDCRVVMTSSRVSGNRSDEIVNCYLLESENVTTGVLSIRDEAVLPGSNNRTLACFIRIGSQCNAKPLNVIDEWKFEILTGSIIGVIASLLTLVSLTVYCRKKQKNEGHFRHALRQHMLRHAGKNYKCGLPGCPTVLRTANELRSHRQLVHESGSSDRQFRCNECSYAAKTRTQLRRHNRKHEVPTEQESPRHLSCSYSNCNFTTKITSHLTRHMRLHTGTKPYKCRHCKYASNNLENLRKHVLSTSLHPGKTIYECDACRASGSPDPYCTNFAKELRAHLLEAHPREFPRPSHASDHVASIFGIEREQASPTPDVNNPYEDSITVRSMDHAIKSEQKSHFAA